MSEIDERVRGDRDTEIRKVENGKYKRETKKERKSEGEKKKTRWQQQKYKTIMPTKEEILKERNINIICHMDS